MENKIIKSIKLDCFIPIVLLNVNTRYQATKKPSGISFILLEIIQKFQGDKNIADLLIEFGIPKDTLHIFANEMFLLKKIKIIDSIFDDTYLKNINYFSKLRINDVKLTSLGMELFNRGEILTGEEKSKKKIIYFNPSTKGLEFDYPNLISDSENIFDKIVDRLNTNGDDDLKNKIDSFAKNNQNKIGLTKYEYITNIDYDYCEYKLEKFPIEINITKDNLFFEMQKHKEFFLENYCSKIIEKCLKNNESFTHTKNIKDITFSNFYQPSEIKNILDEKVYFILLENQNYDFNLTPNKIISNNLLSSEIWKEELSDVDDIDFAFLTNIEIKWFNCIKTKIWNEQIEDYVQIDLIFENSSKEKLNSILEKIEHKLNNIKINYFSNDEIIQIFKIISYISQQKNDLEIFTKFVEKQLINIPITIQNWESKINTLLLIESEFNKHQEWKEFFKEKLNCLYKDKIELTNESNINENNKLLCKIKDILNISTKDYLDEIIDKMKKHRTNLYIYSKLINLGFLNDDIFETKNLKSFIYYLLQLVLDNKNIGNENKLLSEFEQLKNDLNLLKNNNSKEHSHNVENSLKQIEKYKKYSSVGFLPIEREINSIKEKKVKKHESNGSN